MERVRIISLKNISDRQVAIIRNGQMESAKVWMVCKDMHLIARKERTLWPVRSDYKKSTNGGKFALHSQTVQAICHTFDAAIQSTRKNRQAGRTEIRYPWRDKRFFPLMWPAQAMCLKQNSIIPYGT